MPAVSPATGLNIYKKVPLWDGYLSKTLTKLQTLNMTRVEIQTRIQPILDRGDCYIFKGVGSFYYRFATFMTPSIFR